MATYFGAPRRAHRLTVEMQWLVGGLITISIVLFTSIVVLAVTDTSAANAIAVAPETKLAAGSETVYEVLIAKERIEEGMPLDRRLFQRLTLSEDEIPFGAIDRKDWGVISRSYAKNIIMPDAIITVDDISQQTPSAIINIPEGYRLATIQADARQLAGGFATPNSRVDVLWLVKRNGEALLVPLVQHAKIVSVNGETRAIEWAKINGNVNVSLLVTTRDAAKIELARTEGSLSLSLLGKTSPLVTQGGLGSMSIREILHREKPQKKHHPAVDGRIIYTDDNGREVQRQLVRGEGWVR